MHGLTGGAPIVANKTIPQRNMRSVPPLERELAPDPPVVSNNNEAVMRRWKISAILGLGVLAALPGSADARSRFSPGGIFGLVTAPLRMVTRGVAGPAIGPRFHQRGMAARALAIEGTETAGIERPRPEQGSEPNRARRISSPPAAANGYESILGYALWPDDYADRFWAQGYGDMMTAMIVPAARSAFAAAATAKTSDAPRDVPTSVAAAGMCGPQTKDAANKPIERIARTIELTEAQRGTLEQLRLALIEAIERGQTACREAAPRAPAERLKAMIDGLWALRDAALLLRTPLDNFSSSLDDAQKARLTGEPSDRRGNRTEAGNAERTCADIAAGSNAMPINEIDRAVHPTQEQRASLDMLRGLSAEMAGYLSTSCPQERPPTAVGRLDAAADRINAMLYAAMTIDPAINDFYYRLSDEQKAQFNSLRR